MDLYGNELHLYPLIQNEFLPLIHLFRQQWQSATRQGQEASGIEPPTLTLVNNTLHLPPTLMAVNTAILMSCL